MFNKIILSSKHQIKPKNYFMGNSFTTTTTSTTTATTLAQNMSDVKFTVQYSKN
jgi:hypothetical protein